MDWYPIYICATPPLCHLVTVFVLDSPAHQLLKDLTALCELLYMLTQRLQSNPQYMTSLCQLIELCGKPFLKQKISDENNYTPNVIQTLNLLGQLTVAGQDPITAAVTSAIASFYRQENINQAFLEGIVGVMEMRCYRTTHFCRAADD